MIDLYSWYTSNGRKISIALEELELPYRVNPWQRIDLDAYPNVRRWYESIAPDPQ